METMQLMFQEGFCSQLYQDLKDGRTISNYTEEGESFSFSSNDLCCWKDFRVNKDALKKINTENPQSIDCAIMLYEAFPDLTPLMASYSPFWLYLAHVELAPYMRARWNNVLVNRNGKENDKSAQIKYIIDYWFPELGDTTRTWLPNLWWAVYLTVDPNREDPYELTKILFKQEDLRTRTLGTYTLFRHKPATVASLSFIASHMDSTFKHDFQNKCRYMMKYLNYLGGCRLLSYMDEDFFTEMLNKKIADIAKVS